MRQLSTLSQFEHQPEKPWLRQALLARPRVSVKSAAGELVAHWREQKSSQSQGTVIQGGQWHRTAMVIGKVGHNYIIAHRRQVLRCAPEQLRAATTEWRKDFGSNSGGRTAWHQGLDWGRHVQRSTWWAVQSRRKDWAERSLCLQSATWLPRIHVWSISSIECCWNAQFLRSNRASSTW